MILERVKERDFLKNCYIKSDNKIKSIRIFVIIIIVLSLLTNLLTAVLEQNAFDLSLNDFSIYNSDFRKMNINAEIENIKAAADYIHVSYGEYVTVMMITHNYELTEENLSDLTAKKFALIRNKVINLQPEVFFEMSHIYQSLINDFVYFPVPFSSAEFPWVTYVDSWGNERTYGGERNHEGTDIMAKKNISGVYPIVSVCSGIIANIGWLELGGYRIGIESQNGIYYYYAHLASYAEGLKEGDEISQGQLLGFMGNTGYSKVEGTSGKFDVHLHFGIYITAKDGEEYAVNPYFLLKRNENKVLYYNYKM